MDIVETTNQPASGDLSEFEARLPSHFNRPHKRTSDSGGDSKSLQACDRCRTKKIKCLSKDEQRADNITTCHPCHTASLQCTFALPLTAARSKRVRRALTGLSSGGEPGGPEIDPAWRAGSHIGSGLGDLRTRCPAQEPRDMDIWDLGLQSSSAREVRSTSREIVPSSRTSTRHEGPTALSYILHSTPTLPLTFLTEFDRSQNYSMKSHNSTTAEPGDGHILVTHYPASPTSSQHTLRQSTLEAVQSPTWPEVVSRLVDAFHQSSQRTLPIVLPEDKPEGLLRNVMASVSASRKNCPKEIFHALRDVINKQILELDVMLDATRENMQTLFATCLVVELGVGGTASPLSVNRARLASALRMAQDLSLDQHGRRGVQESDKRMWSCALVLDTWTAARMGARMLLHPTYFLQESPGDHGSFLDHLVHLSGLLSQVLVEIYGPTGIKHTSNDTLLALRTSIHGFPMDLPLELRFPNSTTHSAGILHLLHTAVKLLFYRPFMRFSFIPPSHLEINVDVPTWVELATASKSAIEWAVTLEDAGDLGSSGIYALNLCCWIQYHTWARRREWDGVVSLEKACRDGVDKWTRGVHADHMPLQRSQLSPITLLYEATQTPSPSASFFIPSSRGLNPTPGALNRLPETQIAGITFLRDPSHPNGGVLVATKRAAEEIKDLPPGTVIIGGDEPPNPLRAQTAEQPFNLNGFDFTWSGPNPLHGPDGVDNVSTPDWEAAVAALNLPLFDGYNVAQNGT